MPEKNLLLWIDLPTAQFWRHDLKTGETRSDVVAVESLLGAIAPTSDPDVLLLAHAKGIALLNIETLAIMPFADPEQGRDGVMYNDAKIDRLGRLWVGTSHVKELEPRGALWVIDKQKKATLVDTGFAIANGPAFSIDGREVARIDLPSPHVTSLTFGGPNYDRLFITTAWDGADEATRKSHLQAGHIFHLVPGPKGLPEPRFKLT